MNSCLDLFTVGSRQHGPCVAAESRVTMTSTKAHCLLNVHGNGPTYKVSGLTFVICIIVELGPPSGAPYSYRKEKETHELIFSWLSWLAVLLVGVYARQRRRRQSRATGCVIGWQRYAALVYRVLLWYWTSKLWSIKTRYPLTSITWPYRGLKFKAHRGRVFFYSWPLTKCWFFDWIAGSCQVNLLKTGQDCSEAG